MQPQLCRHFITGSCRFGRSCKFSHIRPEDAWQQRQWREVQVSSSGAHLELGGQHHAIRVMSYNVLADGLAHEHHFELYRTARPGVLDWRSRCALLLREVALWRPDVLALQEVDNYGTLAEALLQQGYEGVYAQRTGNRYDGCATFFNSRRLALERHEVVHMSRTGLKDNVALMALLRPLMQREAEGHGASEEEQQVGQQEEVPAGHGGGAEAGRAAGGGSLPDGPRLLVGNTHILFNPRRGDVKLGQVRTILEVLHRMREEAGGESQCALLMCGDFNSVPGSGVYRLLANGHLDCGSVDRKTVSGQVEGQGWTQYQQQQRWQQQQQQHYAAAGHGAGSPMHWGMQGTAAAAATQMYPTGPPHFPAQQHLGGAAVPAAMAAAIDGMGHGRPAPPIDARAVQHGVFSPGSIPPQGWPLGGDTHAPAAAAAASYHIPPPLPPAGRPPPHFPGEGGAPAPPLHTPVHPSAPPSSPMHHTWSMSDLKAALGSAEAARGALMGVDPRHWVLQHGLGLRSVYASACGGAEPAFTTCHDKFIGAVDYIWHADGQQQEDGEQVEQVGEQDGRTGGTREGGGGCSLRPVRVLLPPALGSLHSGLPSELWPSDHVSLVADFELRGGRR